MIIGDKMERMFEIERICNQLEQEITNILKSNFPLDSVYFLSNEDQMRVRQYDTKIRELKEEYLRRYWALPEEERRNFKYKNLPEKEYCYQPQGLRTADRGSDEYELHEAFSRAMKYGKIAIENMNKARLENNMEEYAKNQRVLNTCNRIFSVHYWGEDRKKSLERYAQRIANGRTIEDDKRDYLDLVEECRRLSVEYAQAILDGVNEDDESFWQRYQQLFQREEELTEFMTRDEMNEISVNLYSMRLAARKDAEKFIEENKETIQK